METAPLLMIHEDGGGFPSVRGLPQSRIRVETGVPPMTGGGVIFISMQWHMKAVGDVREEG